MWSGRPSLLLLGVLLCLCSLKTIHSSPDDIPPEESSVTPQSAGTTENPLNPGALNNQGPNANKADAESSKNDKALPLWLILVIVFLVILVILVPGIVVCVICSQKKNGRNDQETGKSEGKSGGSPVVKVATKSGSVTKVRSGTNLTKTPSKTKVTTTLSHTKTPAKSTSTETPAKSTKAAKKPSPKNKKPKNAAKSPSYQTTTCTELQSTAKLTEVTAQGVSVTQATVTQG